MTPCYRKKPRQRKIAREGYPAILTGTVATAIVWYFLSPPAAFPFLLLTFYIAIFFRNPNRLITDGEGLITSPADGKVMEVVECEEPRYLKGRAKRISIFMSPFNCHINRAPVRGKVVECFYKPGSFKAAFKRKAMEHNEHHAVLLEGRDGDKWLVVQVAGFLARRIVSYVAPGEYLNRGERYGLIQFGSRLDLYCPLHCDIFVKRGHKVFAGRTILGVDPTS